MPFYNTEDRAVFPQKPQRPQRSAQRDQYKYMDKSELIALCDERGLKSAKGTPIGRNQRKAYYIERLKQWDSLQPPQLPEDND